MSWFLIIEICVIINSLINCKHTETYFRKVNKQSQKKNFQLIIWKTTYHFILGSVIIGPFFMHPMKVSGCVRSLARRIASRSDILWEQHYIAFYKNVCINIETMIVNICLNVDNMTKLILLTSKWMDNILRSSIVKLS